MEPIKSAENPITVECPCCDGHGGFVEDNYKKSLSISRCYYCNGKAIISWNDANKWHELDRNRLTVAGQAQPNETPFNQD